MELEPGRNTTTPAEAADERHFRRLWIAANIAGLLVIGGLIFDVANDNQRAHPALHLPALVVIVALAGMHWNATRNRTRP